MGRERARGTGSDLSPLAEARALLRAHGAVDLHTDTIHLALAGVDPLDPAGGSAAGPPLLAEGGFSHAVYAFWVMPHLGPERGWARARAMAARFAEVRRVAAERHALTLAPALEDARVLLGRGFTETTEARIEELVRWGTRYVTLTWNTGNAWATSCEDTRSGAGLTSRGRTLVAALDAAEITTDLSHLSDRAARDVLEVATRPPIASHSSSRALCAHPRNLPDDLARAIAERGGVIGVNVHRPFVAVASRDATLDRVADHVEHLFRVAGEEAVAFGSDFDGIPAGPTGLERASAFPALVAMLLDRGHPGGRVAAFAGGNARRVLWPEHVASRAGGRS